MKEPLDPRSTGRKRLRKALIKQVKEDLLEFKCVGALGKPCPQNITNKVLANGHVDCKQPDGSWIKLQADHINKDILDCDPANGEWKCPSCHKVSDLITEKGVSTVGDSFGYGDYSD